MAVVCLFKIRHVESYLANQTLEVTFTLRFKEQVGVYFGCRLDGQTFFTNWGTNFDNKLPFY